MMATEKKAAPTPARRPAAAASAAASEMLAWVMQQGRRWYVEMSAGVPDTATPEGERTKKVHFSFATRAEAEDRARQRAEETMGVFEP